jgi:hypothetical protein
MTKKRAAENRHGPLNHRELKREVRKLLNALYEACPKKQEKDKGRSVRF